MDVLFELSFNFFYVKSIELKIHIGECKDYPSRQCNNSGVLATEACGGQDCQSSGEAFPSWLLTDGTRSFLLPPAFDHSLVEFIFQVSCCSNPVAGDSAWSCPLSFPSPEHIGGVTAMAYLGLGVWRWGLLSYHNYHFPCFCWSGAYPCGLDEE